MEECISSQQIVSTAKHTQSVCVWHTMDSAVKRQISAQGIPECVPHTQSVQLVYQHVDTFKQSQHLRRHSKSLVCVRHHGHSKLKKGLKINPALHVAASQNAATAMQCLSLLCLPRVQTPLSLVAMTHNSTRKHAYYLYPLVCVCE